MFFFIRIHWNDSVVNLLSINKKFIFRTFHSSKTNRFCNTKLIWAFRRFQSEIQLSFLFPKYRIEGNSIPGVLYSCQGNKIQVKPGCRPAQQRSNIFSCVSIDILSAYPWISCNLERISRFLYGSTKSIIKYAILAISLASSLSFTFFAALISAATAIIEACLKTAPFSLSPKK